MPSIEPGVFETLGIISIFAIIFIGVFYVLVGRIIASGRDQTMVPFPQSVSSAPPVLTIEVAFLVKIFLKPSDLESSYIIWRSLSLPLAVEKLTKLSFMTAMTILNFVLSKKQMLLLKSDIF